jgi:hypothetical protein
MANNPALLKMPLATDGDKATIPETSGATTGEFSQQYGFQQINALPLQAGGIAPRREDFNGAFYLLSGIAFMAQKGFPFRYDAAQDYYTGCVVVDPSDNEQYVCISDMTAGTVSPHSDTGTYWHKVANVESYFRQPKTAYSYNDVRLAYGMKQPYFLQCTSGGTSKAGDITIPASPSIGSTISDGTVTWTIRKFASTSDIPNVSSFITKVQTPAFNTRAEITTSGTWTAPVTGWYKITLKGGGGGGQGGVVKTSSTKYLCAGGGGGEGGTTIAYQYMTTGTSCSIVIGAGGAGGTAQSGSSPSLTGHEGSNGGSTTITIGSTSYVATGGNGAAGSGGMGGTGTINGASGGCRNVITGDNDAATFSARGGFGGGVGGATAHINSSTDNATQGGGGGGGVARIDTTPYANKGGDGGNGYVWLEYWAN